MQCLDKKDNCLQIASTYIEKESNRLKNVKNPNKVGIVHSDSIVIKKKFGNVKRDHNTKIE